MSAIIGIAALGSFTFHYVSINTVCFVLLVSPVPSLHSTMFLLILSCALIGFFLYRPLHSTMFLLIHSEGYQDPTAGIATLHSTMFLLIRLNASLGDYMYKTLHSTMFLLIQEWPHRRILTSSTLHSTMFLLIRGCWHQNIWDRSLYIPLCFY